MSLQITPQTIRKSIEETEFSTRVADARMLPGLAVGPLGGSAAKVAEGASTYAEEVNREELVKILEKEMEAAAESLDFERAALLRDQLFELRTG